MRLKISFAKSNFSNFIIFGNFSICNLLCKFTVKQKKSYPKVIKLYLNHLNLFEDVNDLILCFVETRNKLYFFLKNETNKNLINFCTKSNQI